MRILLTNDDGIHSPGLDAMLRALLVRDRISSEGGIPLEPDEIWIIAPETERSGVSHALTLKKPNKVKKLDERKFSCSGTPADCVIAAGLEIIDRRPDIVISGINRGPNLGTDIIYSGTCGAARQAALVDIPAIAISCASMIEPLEYKAAASFVAKNLESLRALWAPGSFININAPSSNAENLSPRWAVPGKNQYNDKIKCFDGMDGYRYCFMVEGRNERRGEAYSDHAIVERGDIALSLIDIHPRSIQDFNLNGNIVTLGIKAEPRKAGEIYCGLDATRTFSL